MLPLVVIHDTGMKYTLLTYLMIITLLTGGCSSGNDAPSQTPEGVLHPDTLKQVLMDIHLAEAALKRNQLEGDTAVIQAQQYYNEIYQVHNITEDEFMTSMAYYRTRQQQFQTMYEELIKAMSKKEAKLSGKGE
ncbi:MAG: hypothetical protein BRD50_05030 [Bacteroidetes bacterium SW_11_45_7]|nr:MAG: hypothetical protein BRD50_05030 [Bacteroidetes bacterium SW_11_45_7]